MNIEQINQKIFAELGREKQLLEYRDIIYQLLGVVIDFANTEGTPLRLSNLEYFNPFCAKLRGTASGKAACTHCDLSNSRLSVMRKSPLVYHCFAKLIDVVVPLFDHKNNFIGVMTTGQFHRQGDALATPQEITVIATKHGLDPQEMIDLYGKTTVLSEQQIQGMIKYLQVIGKIIVRTHNNLIFMEKIDSQDKITLIKKFVEENYMKSINIADTARRFYLSAGYFCRYFRNEVGISFMNYVNIYRVSKAKEFLRHSKRGVSEIIDLCGFGSFSQFNRTFKDTTGCSPREYRKTVQNSQNGIGGKRN